MTALLYDLPHLVDLSLGTPESGTVNFNILHVLLHAIVKILDADNIRIELTDTPICKPENSSVEGTGIISIKEYEIESGGKKTLIIKPARNVDKMFVIKKGTIGDETHENNISSKIVEQAAVSKVKPEVDTKVEPEAKFNVEPKVQSKVEPEVEFKVEPEVQTKVEIKVHSKELPKATASKTNLKGDSKITEIEDKIKKMESSIKDIYNNLSKITLTLSTTPLKEVSNKTASPKHTVEKVKQEQVILKAHASNDQAAELIVEINNIKSEINNIKTSINNITEKKIADRRKTKHDTIEKIEEPKEIEELLTCPKLEESINLKFDELTTKFMNLTDEVLDIERNLTTLSYQVEEISRPKGKSDVSIGDILKEMMVIKGKIQTVMSETSFLMTERERMKTNVDSMTIAIDDVQRNKVDRDEIDELLAEKADYNMLQRKVSIDEFDANKRDYNHNLTETIAAIDTRHENLYKEFQILNSFMETKVNQDEIKDIKNNLERRIQTLNNKIDVILNQKDPEAAGTKIKILKDINCISCSQKVLMKTEEDNIPKRNAIPGHKSIKPFLTYELDTVRKQMKDVGTSRNLHHFESMLKDAGITTNSKAQQIVNRYCGGSHTIITAQDRVDRGRCKKLHGTKPTVTKCICNDPKPSVKQYVKTESTTKYYKEADICQCPSQEDPLEKCMSAQVKRCLEIDARRRMICKFEAEQNYEICKALIDSNQKLRNEKDEEKYTCVVKQEDKSTLCRDEIEKYKQCKMLSESQKKHFKEIEDKGSLQQMQDQNIEKKGIQLSEREGSHQEKKAYDQEENIVKEDLPDINELEEPKKFADEVLSEADKSEYSVKVAEEVIPEINESHQTEQSENLEQLEELKEPEELERSEQLDPAQPEQPEQHPIKVEV